MYFCMKYTSAYVLVFLACCCGTLSCPPQESLLPCKCVEVTEILHKVTCSGLDNYESISRAAKALRHTSYSVDFRIELSDFVYIPSDIFKDTNVIYLEVRNTTLVDLTDADTAFRGLEEKLVHLTITDCTVMNEWNWNVLRDLQRLTALQFRQNTLQSIDENLGALFKASIISVLDLSENHISFLHKKAFSDFRKISVLLLSKNEIKRLERTMLPMRNSMLYMLHLDNNKIEDLPEDVFSDLPNLRSINLSFNKLLTISEKTFSPIWDSLNTFQFQGNDLLCDCRIEWILTQKQPGSFYDATCHLPQGLHGKHVRDLKPEDLWC